MSSESTEDSLSLEAVRVRPVEAEADAGGARRCGDVIWGAAGRDDEAEVEARLEKEMVCSDKREPM